MDRSRIRKEKVPSSNEKRCEWTIALTSKPRINHRIVGRPTVVCVVAWSLNESEAGVDLVLIQTSLTKCL